VRGAAVHDDTGEMHFDLAMTRYTAPVRQSQGQKPVSVRLSEQKGLRVIGKVACAWYRYLEDGRPEVARQDLKPFAETRLRAHYCRYGEVPTDLLIVRAIDKAVRDRFGKNEDFREITEAVYRAQLIVQRRARTRDLMRDLLGNQSSSSGSLLGALVEAYVLGGHPQLQETVDTLNCEFARESADSTRELESLRISEASLKAELVAERKINSELDSRLRTTPGIEAQIRRLMQAVQVLSDLNAKAQVELGQALLRAKKAEETLEIEAEKKTDAMKLVHDQLQMFGSRIATSEQENSLLRSEAEAQLRRFEAKQEDCDKLRLRTEELAHQLDETLAINQRRSAEFQKIETDYTKKIATLKEELQAEQRQRLCAEIDRDAVSQEAQHHGEELRMCEAELSEARLEGRREAARATAGDKALVERDAKIAKEQAEARRNLDLLLQLQRLLDEERAKSKHVERKCEQLSRDMKQIVSQNTASAEDRCIATFNLRSADLRFFGTPRLTESWIANNREEEENSMQVDITDLKAWELSKLQDSKEERWLFVDKTISRSPFNHAWLSARFGLAGESLKELASNWGPNEFARLKQREELDSVSFSSKRRALRR
jgi:hypothetical protein